MLQPKVTAGRRVGVGEDDSAVRLFVVFGVDFEAVCQRYCFAFDVVEATVHGVEAVSYVREQDGLTVLEQCVKYVCQDFIGAITQKDLFGLYAVIAGDGLAQAFAFGIRVQTQAVIELSLDGLDYLWRWAKWVFVGVQLYQVGHFGLFAWYIRNQAL